MIGQTILIDYYFRISIIQLTANQQQWVAVELFWANRNDIVKHIDVNDFAAPIVRELCVAEERRGGDTLENSRS